MAELEPHEIKKAVVARYGARARRAGTSERIELLAIGAGASCAAENCCGPSAVSDEEVSFVRSLYAERDIAGLPQGALEAAAGCGNPTAIAELRPDETVLDLGSGGGIDCFLAAKQVGAHGKVIGVDMTPDMLNLARENARKMGAANVEFKLGEIEDLPLPDSSVDVVISNCVINLSPDKPQVLRESFRVLRPGGRLRVSDMVWLEKQPTDVSNLDSWSACIAGALPLEEYLATVRSAGFINVRAELSRVEPNKSLASVLISAEKL